MHRAIDSTGSKRGLPVSLPSFGKNGGIRKVYATAGSVGKRSQRSGAANSVNLFPGRGVYIRGCGKDAAHCRTAGASDAVGGPKKP
jgi:hypothetical protein